MPRSRDIPAWRKAGNTDRWTEILFRALASRVARRWRFVSFRGKGGGEWRGIVDILAIRKDTSRSTHYLLKSGDLFEIILVQMKAAPPKGLAQRTYSGFGPLRGGTAPSGRFSSPGAVARSVWVLETDREQVESVEPQRDLWIGSRYRDLPPAESLRRPTSTSIKRTSGGGIGRGGPKWSSSASFKFASASSSVSPWLATSTSRHWETHQFPSRQTDAVKARFMTSFFHTAPRLGSGGRDGGWHTACHIRPSGTGFPRDRFAAPALGRFVQVSRVRNSRLGKKRFVGSWLGTIGVHVSEGSYC
jgi:hypothetical protein